MGYIYSAMISDHLNPFYYLFSPYRTHIPDFPVLLLWRSTELPEDKQRALPQVCDRRLQQGPFQQPLPQPAAEEELWVGTMGKQGVGREMRATKGRSNIKTRFYISAGIFVKWLWTRLCFLSELDTAVDNYMPMHSSTARGQEEIGLLTINSGDMDSFEGEHACCQRDRLTY